MTAHTPVPLRRRGASNAGDGRTDVRPKAPQRPSASPLPSASSSCPPPSAPLPRTLPPRWSPPPLPGPVPGPSRSGLRWLRKERKNRKQNFLAAAGHQLHILQMPPSKNKPAAAPPAGSPPTHHSGPLPQELPDCGEGLIPHSRAPPGAPLPYTPLPGTKRLFCPEARPQGTRWLGPLPWGAPLRPSSHSLLCPPPGAYFSSAPGFRAPLPQMLSPNVTLSLASGHRDPARPSPTAPEPPGSAPLQPPAGPSAQRPTSPGTTSLPAHSAPRQLPRTFPRTQAAQQTAARLRAGAPAPCAP